MTSMPKVQFDLIGDLEVDPQVRRALQHVLVDLNSASTMLFDLTPDGGAHRRSEADLAEKLDHVATFVSAAIEPLRRLADEHERR